jgi:hypothetical protein
MIMPETDRENRHRADTAQTKTCQTVQKPDINNNSFPDPEFANLGHGNSGVAPLIIGISGGCVAMREPELEQRWRSRN